MRHDADARRHEEQREMLQQAGGAGAQFVADRAAHEQGEEEQRHADDGAGERPVEQAHQQFAGKLEKQEKGEDADHGSVRNV